MPYSIWKFTLKEANEQQIEMPKGARVLSTEEQYGKIVLYALVDTLAEKETRTIWTFVTGHQILTGHRVLDQAAGARFVGTVKMEGGLWMFHIFCDSSDSKEVV